MSTVVINSYRQAAVNWYDGAYAAWQAKGAASLAASYLDVTGNGRDLTAGVAPTWDAVNGWAFNGVDQWLSTPVVIASSSHSVLILFTNGNTSATDAGFLLAATDLSNYIVRVVRFTFQTSNRRYRNGTTAIDGGAAASSGVMGYAGATGYYNGAADATITNLSDLPGTAFSIAALKTGRFLSGYTSVYIQKVGIWDSVLDSATVATKSAQMAAE